MIDPVDYLDGITQEQYDEWIEGRRSISGLVEEHRLIALLFRDRILGAIDEYETDDLTGFFQSKRPDIDIRDKEKMKERIETEFSEIQQIL